MEDQRFADYIERGLAFEQSHGAGGTAALTDREEIAWSLYEEGSAAGRLLLGDSLLRTRISFARRETGIVSFARSLVEEGFAALREKSEKSSWDWYYLGIAHEFGRGTGVDHREAAECFGMARKAGNPYAGFEEIWSGFLGGRSLFETISRLRSCEGKLRRFARASARSLSLLALGPTNEVGSYQHAWRIMEISKLLHLFLYHDAGSRHINVTVEAEMRDNIELLESLGTPSAAFVLYLIAKRSRRNPTSRDPKEWLPLSLTIESEDFLALLKQENLDDDELKLVFDHAESRGWKDSELARYVTAELDLLEWDESPPENGGG